MAYRYLEDIAIADIAFKACAKTLEEMFIAAGDATMNVMVEELESISETKHEYISAEARELDMLLFQMLQELIYFKDAQKLLMRVSRVEILKEESYLVLKAEASGEEIDPRKHKLSVDVKAVTLHKLKVEETPEGWEATVVLDI